MAAATAQNAKGFDIFAAMAAVDLTVAMEYRPVDRGERMLGVMSENLQRLNRVRVEWLEKHKAAEKDILTLIKQHIQQHEEGGAHDCAAFKLEIEQMAVEVDSLAAKSKAVNDIFWSLVELEFGIEPSEGTSLGIREGSQVVVMPTTAPTHEKLKTIIDFLMVRV